MVYESEHTFAIFFGQAHHAFFCSAAGILENVKVSSLMQCWKIMFMPKSDTEQSAMVRSVKVDRHRPLDIMFMAANIK